MLILLLIGGFDRLVREDGREMIPSALPVLELFFFAGTL